MSCTFRAETIQQTLHDEGIYDLSMDVHNYECILVVASPTFPYPEILSQAMIHFLCSIVFYDCHFSTTNSLPNWSRGCPCILLDCSSSLAVGQDSAHPGRAVGRGDE